MKLAQLPRAPGLALLAFAIAAALVACQEPNSLPPEPVATPAAPTAPTVAAADAAAAAAQEMPPVSSQPELKPDTMCNLERIDDQLLGSSEPFLPADRHHVVLTGWMGDEQTKGLPTGSALMVRQIGSERAWQLPLVLDVERADVAEVKSAPALRVSGFRVVADFSTLPTGSFRMLLVHERDGNHYACDNGRDLKLSQ